MPGRLGLLHLLLKAEDDEFGGPRDGHFHEHVHVAVQNVLARHGAAQAHGYAIGVVGLRAGQASLLTNIVARPWLRPFAAHLQKQWDSIARRMDFDYNGLSMADAKLLRAGADIKFWEGTRATTPPSTYKATKARQCCA